MNPAEHQDRIGAACVVLGLILIAASFAVPFFRVGQGNWKNEMAVKLQQAAANYHDALHANADNEESNGALAGSLQNARAEYEHYQNRLKTAKTEASDLVSALRWAGVAFCIAGTLLYVRHCMADRHTDEQ